MLLFLRFLINHFTLPFLEFTFLALGDVEAIVLPDEKYSSTMRAVGIGEWMLRLSTIFVPDEELKLPETASLAKAVELKKSKTMIRQR